MNTQTTNNQTKWKSRSDGIKLGGVADSTLSWVSAHQLKDPALWQRFVNQFRIRQDSANNGWRGEYWGKMMRGAVMVYQYTADAELYRVLTDTVQDLLTAQDANGSFSSYEDGKGFCHWDLWCRKYILLGLEHYLEICTDGELRSRILAALCRHADAILAVVGDQADGKKPITATSGIYGGMNSASVLEPMVRLCRLTGEERYLRFAEHILSTGGSRGIDIFKLAYEDQIAPYAYGVNKAYEMMSCFEGLVEYYELTGEEYWRDAAVRFAKKVLKTDVTVIGCCGTMSELFDHSAVRQTEIPEHVMQETCVSVTWMKLCRRLFAVSGDVCFLDAIEKTYYNAYLSTLNTECRHARNNRLRFLDDAVPSLMPFDSYSPLIPGVRGKETGGAQRLEDGTYYGCCAAIAPAGAGLFPQTVLWQTDDRKELLLALYERGTVSTILPSGQALRIKTETDYPVENTVRVTLQLAQKEHFSLGLRIPAWSKQSRLNCRGEEKPVASGICKIECDWQDGDVLELTLDDNIYLQNAPIYETETVYKINWNDGSMYPVVLQQSEEARHYVCFFRGALTLGIDRRAGRDLHQPLELCAEDGASIPYREDRGASPYPCMTALRLQLPKEELLLTDYAAVGRLWSRESESAAWIPTVSPTEKT